MPTKSMSLLPLSISPKSLLQPTIFGRRIEYRGSSLRTIYHSMHEAEPNDLESMRIRALAIGAQSIGAFALGALAVGALALGVVGFVALLLVERKSSSSKSTSLL